ncbi:MAG: hypothetical protein NXI08_16680 [bacterium]|nr:hypothetical protein [bacterium]
MENKKKQIKLLKGVDFSSLPLHYQFIEIKEYNEKIIGNGKISEGLISVAKYQTRKCRPYSHYKPISKIVNEDI